MTPHLDIDPEQVKGFFSPAEGEALYRAAQRAANLGPLLEIGSYCGKSTLYLAAAARTEHSLVFAVDHHAGSEEHQKGELFHDPELYDATTGAVDSFRTFRHNLRRAGLNEWVVPIVAASAQASRYWNTLLGLVFIDGGHSLEAALEDYRCWCGHIARDGILAIHDVYPNAEDGGQAPRTIWRLAQDSGLFREIERVDSLALLRRL